MKTVLLATQKPFSEDTVNGIRTTLEEAGYKLELLESYKEQSDLVAAVKNVTGIIVRSDKVTKEVIENAPNIKIVVRAGAGYDNLDLDACTANGVVAMNTPGQNSNAVAELVIGLMIYGNRNFYTPGTGSELKGRSLGLHAYGNVGKLVARHANGLGMKVYAYDPFVSAETIQKDNVQVVNKLEELYASCNYVSLHIPALPDTVGSIDYELISKMPIRAMLINTARKEVIDEEDLMKVLKERTDIKYLTDVMPGNYDELHSQCPDQVFATPKKLGAETAEANYAAGLAAANQIVNYLKTGDKTFQLNM